MVAFDRFSDVVFLDVFKLSGFGSLAFGFSSDGCLIVNEKGSWGLER